MTKTYMINVNLILTLGGEELPVSVLQRECKPVLEALSTTPHKQECCMLR